MSKVTPQIAVEISNALMKKDITFSYIHPMDNFWVAHKRGSGEKLTIYPTKDKIKVGHEVFTGIVESINKNF